MTATDSVTTPAGEGDPALRLRGVTKAFGGLRAVNDVDLDVEHGQRLGLLGPNGAGKTTLFNLVAGDLTPTSGQILIEGTDATLSPSRQRPALGVARTYQRTRLFGGLTVEDNLYLAQTGKIGRHRALWRAQVDADLRATAREMAARVWLQERLDQPVEDLSHGEARQLEVGMALITDPGLLMLDEPASGLSRGEREGLIELLGQLPDDMTLILIEHDMDVALQTAERVVVMAEGEIVAQGPTDEIRDDPTVRAIYLGEGDTHG